MTKNYPVKSASELYSQADKILENFNFERVHDHMKYTKWSWYKNQLLLGVISNGEEVGMHATGGLQAIKFPWGLTLNFIYEHSEG